MKKKTKKRQRLGVGFIWFGDDQWPTGYRTVSLTSEPHGKGHSYKIKVGRLGGWQKVKLYAEWVS